MKTITAQQLKSMIDEKKDMALINVLPAESFEKGHIPGSLNVPKERDSFVKDVASLVGGRERTVVVYCASRECDASSTAAHKLEKAGFGNVIHFRDGMAGWRLAGFEVQVPATANR